MKTEIDKMMGKIQARKTREELVRLILDKDSPRPTSTRVVTIWERR